VGVVPMATLIGDHRSVLDVNPIISEKPTISDDLISAQSEGAQDKTKTARKADIHRSWADMIKLQPQDQAHAGLRPLKKR
jgi:hypothetical protein